LPHHTVAREARKFYLGNQLRLDPRPVFASAWNVLAAEPAVRGLEGIQFLQDASRVACVKARTDTTGVNEVIATVNTDNE
jgi:hypothetical protein